VGKIFSTNQYLMIGHRLFSWIDHRLYLSAEVRMSDDMRGFGRKQPWRIRRYSPTIPLEGQSEDRKSGAE
jgi:hypothetical protein